MMNGIVQLFDANAFRDGSVLGCDFVDTVVQLGPDVSNLKNGNIVAGFI